MEKKQNTHLDAHKHSNALTHWIMGAWGITSESQSVGVMEAARSSNTQEIYSWGERQGKKTRTH